MMEKDNYYDNDVDYDAHNDGKTCCHNFCLWLSVVDLNLINRHFHLSLEFYYSNINGSLDKLFLFQFIKAKAN